MNLDLHASVAGRYKLEAFQLDDQGNEFGRRVVADWFDNLITDVGLDMMGTGGNPIAWCQVGTGNTPPAFTDSTLVSRLAASNVAGPGGVFAAIVATPVRYGYKRNVYRFAPGVAAGNLSEVGVSPASTGSVYSRALILDALGNPTTITILPIEYLDVVYEIRLYVPDTDVVTTHTISGVVYTVTRRAYDSSNQSYWASFIPHAIAGSNSNWWRMVADPTGMVLRTQDLPGTHAVDMATETYLAGTHYIERYGTFSITQANVNINVVGISSAIGKYQFGFSPVIPKDNTKTLTLRFRIHWARHAP